MYKLFSREDLEFPFPSDPGRLIGDTVTPIVLQAVTVPIGKTAAIAKNLLRSTREALFQAVEQCKPGKRIGDISVAVQKHVEADGFSVIRTLVGHGVGRNMHEDPQIPNYGTPGTGAELETGMVLAVEPMVNAGNHPVRMGEDSWAIYSQDGSLAAHF